MPRAKVAIVLEVLRNGAADIAGTLGLKTSIQLADESRRSGTAEKKPRVNARGANGND
jgi:hypothetical protein